jgi:glucose/arabinose dehydrogenase
VGRALIAAVLALLAWSAPAAAQVSAPDGVRVQRVASGIPHPSNLAFDRRGRLWVTSAGHQTAASDGVWMVRRRGARPVHVVDGLFSALGVLWHRGELYVSHVVPYATFADAHLGRVVAYSGFDGRRFTRSRVVVDGLPTGRHRVDSLAAGPDGRIYLGVGSQFDAERSSERMSAVVVSFRPNGGGLRIEARGLRNPYGLAFVPGTSRLLVSEHGRDDLGLREPPEELNVVQVRRRAGWYGFPECWGQGGAACRGAVAPFVRMEAHSAPGAVVAVRRFGRWGPSAFVARFGSSFPDNPTGGDIVRVPLRRGRARAVRFATGFGRQEPLGLALGPGGALYVSRWTSGRIDRLVPPRPRARRPLPARLAGRVTALILGLVR